MGEQRDRLRVLLIWPGGLFAGGGNFGVPQLLLLAAAMRRSADADVTVVDLDCERAFGRIDLGRIRRAHGQRRSRRSGLHLRRRRRLGHAHRERRDQRSVRELHGGRHQRDHGRDRDAELGSG